LFYHIGIVIVVVDVIVVIVQVFSFCSQFYSMGFAHGKYS